MKSWILAAILFALSVGAEAQRTVFSEETADPVSSYGMNRTHFSHAFVELSFFVGPPQDTGAELMGGKSRRLTFGHRYKYQLSNHFAMGGELFFQRDGYHPRQEVGKNLPDGLLHDSEKLVFFKLGAGIFHRINYGKRGNHMGRFIDLGAYGTWNAHLRHVVKFKEGGENIRLRRSGMDYPQPFEYGLMARKGFNALSLKVAYRLSPLFKEDAGISEISPLSVGLELGMHPR